MYEICDRALIKILKEFHFEIIVAIGKFAEKNALTALKKNGIGNVKVIITFNVMQNDLKSTNYFSFVKKFFFLTRKQKV